MTWVPGQELFEGGPGVVEVAGDADVLRVGGNVGREGGAGGLGEALLDGVGGFEAGSEGESVQA